jgi:hypothetical protein
MKITKKQLRDLIEETFVVDSKGQAAEIPTRIEDPGGLQMPVIIQPGDPNSKFLKVAEGYREEIIQSHPKGEYILDNIILNPSSDFVDRLTFLTLFNTLDAIPDEDMAIVNGEAAASKLLSHSDFGAIKSRAKDMARDEYFKSQDYDPEGYELLTNPIAKKKAIDNLERAFESKINWYKDLIKNILIHGHPHQYTSGDVRRKIKYMYPRDISSFYQGVDKIKYDILNPVKFRLHSQMIERALEELQDAGIILSGVKPDIGYLVLSPRTIKTLSGQMYDKLKKVGVSDPKFIKPKPNPNLPTLTKEGKIKITKSQLRKLILEADHDDEEESEEYDPLSREDEDKISKFLNPEGMGQAQSLASTIGGPGAFSRLVRTTLERNETFLDTYTGNMMQDVDNIVMEIFEKGLNSMGMTLSYQEGMLMTDEAGITEQEENDIHMELVLGVRKNILNAVENAIVQTLVAIAGDD